MHEFPGTQQTQIRKELAYGITGSNKCKKDIQHPLRRKQSTGTFQCDFFSGRGRICGDHGRVRFRKTTLLNILAALDRPTSGEVLLEGKSITHLTEKEISAFRRKNLGFVFQDFNLLDTFSLRDNIYLPLVLAGEDYQEMEQKIRPIAKALHIDQLLEKFPYEVSGGQKQRAAVARALITDPRLILADEPTGALDSRAASDLLSMFNEVNQEGQTILMVTHSAQAASHASRVLFIKDGQVFHQIYRGTKTRQEMYQMIADTLTILTTGGESHA